MTEDKPDDIDQEESTTPIHDRWSVGTVHYFDTHWTNPLCHANRWHHLTNRRDMVTCGNCLLKMEET